MKRGREREEVIFLGGLTPTSVTFIPHHCTLTFSIKYIVGGGGGGGGGGDYHFSAQRESAAASSPGQSIHAFAAAASVNAFASVRPSCVSHIVISEKSSSAQ